jgi:hypothetical protein
MKTYSQLKEQLQERLSGNVEKIKDPEKKRKADLKRSFRAGEDDARRAKARGLPPHNAYKARTMKAKRASDLDRPNDRSVNIAYNTGYHAGPAGKVSKSGKARMKSQDALNDVPKSKSDRGKKRIWKSRPRGPLDYGGKGPIPPRAPRSVKEK